jgi:hypothetical protein
MLLMVALVAASCVPVSRAQGLDEIAPAATVESGEPVAVASVASVGPVATRLYQPHVMRVAQASRPTELSEPRVFFDLSLQPQLVDFFNERALEDDIARVEHVSMLDLLDQITVGRKLVIFKNAVDAEELVPALAARMDIIGYNLEGGPSNLPEEQADPVGSARRVRNLADQYGLKVALGPSRDFALNYGAAMAPYVDLFVLQVQRVQTEHETVRNFVEPLVEELLAANPALEISIQIRTEGNVDNLVTLVDSLADGLSGVSILTSQETLPTAYTLYSALDVWRWVPPLPPGPDGTPPGEVTGVAPVAPVAPEGGLGIAGTPTVEPRRTSTAVPEPSPTRPTSADGPTRWFLFGSGLLFGVLLTTLGGTWLVVYWQRSRAR